MDGDNLKQLRAVLVRMADLGRVPDESRPDQVRHAFTMGPFSTSIQNPRSKDHMMRFAAIVGLSLAVACGVKFPALAAETNQQRVDRLFAAYDKASSPGCALGVIRDGSFITPRAQPGELA